MTHLTVDTGADSEGRIRCGACGSTLLWLKNGIVQWTFHVRGGGPKRTFGLAANNPALNDLLVICDCGTRWMPIFDQGHPLPAPSAAGVLKPFAAAGGAV